MLFNINKIKWRVAFLIVSLLYLLIIYYFLKSNIQILKRDVEKQYVHQVFLKHQEVNDLFRQYLNSAEFFQHTTFFARGIYGYLQNPSDTFLGRQIIERLLTSNRDEKYANMIMVSEDRKITLAIREGYVFSDTISNAIDLAIQNDTLIQIFFIKDTNFNIFPIYYIVPISINNQKPRVALVLILNTSHVIMPVLEKRLSLFENHEIFFLINNPIEPFLINSKNEYLPITDKQITVKNLTNFRQDFSKIEILKDNNEVRVILPIISSKIFLYFKLPTRVLYAELIQRYMYFIFITIAGLIILFLIFYIVSIIKRKEYFYALYAKEKEWNNKLKEFRTILYSIGDGVITTDIQGRIMYMNPVAEVLTGWKEIEAFKRPLSEVFRIENEFTHLPVENPFECVIKEKRVVGLANHTVLTQKNGKKIPIIDSGAPIVDENNDLLGVVLVFRDQTQEKIKEEQIQEAEKRYYSLFENINDGIALNQLIFDEFGKPINYRLLDVNKKYEEIFKLKKEKIRNKLSTEIYEVDDPPFLDIFGKVFLTGKSHEFETFFAPINKFFHISVFCPEINVFATVFQDITEKKLLENERFRLLNILENSLNEVYIFDYYTYHFEFANKGALLNTGYTFDDLINMTILDLMPELSKDTFELAIQSLKNQEKEKLTFQTNQLRKDGSKYPVEVLLQIQEIGLRKVFVEFIMDVSEKHKFISQIEASHHKYLEIFNSTSEAIFIDNLKGQIIEVNDAVCKLYGYDSKDEILDGNIGDLSANISPYTEEYAQELISKAVNGEPQQFEWLAKRKNGTLFWIEMTLKRAIIEGQDCIIAIGRDIDEQKRSRDLLRKSEEKFRALFENHAAIKLIVDPLSGNIIDANNSAASFYGWSIDQLKSMNISQINTLPFDQLTKFIHFTKEGKQKYFEFKHRLANGEIRDVEVYSSIIMIENKEYLHSIVHDITDKKIIQNALEESEERFRLAFQTSPDSININRLEDGLYIDVNDGFCNITGYTREEVIGKTSNDINIWVNIEDRHRLVAEIKEKGYCNNLEAQFRCKNGKIVTGLMSAKLIMLKEVPHILNITRDISERKMFEEQLRMSKEKAEESDRLKTSFLHNISHEIRTPMNAIVGFADLLKQDNISVDKKNKYVDIINNSAKQLLSIVNDVLEISRLESKSVPINVSSFSIAELFDELYHFYYPKTGNILLSYSIDAKLQNVLVEADKEKINQIMTNLLNNAIKFTINGSIIFGAQVKKDFIEFYVKDTGIGIDSKDQLQIFERFYQANSQFVQSKGGSGLGLSISKNLVELMNGEIWVESEVEKGTTFYFTIPLKTKSKSREKNIHKNIGLNVCTILIVEDIVTNFEYLQALLLMQGITIYWAQTGKEAIEKAKDLKPSVVLLDIKLPDFDGYTVLRAIKNIDSSIKIIVQSAYSLEEEKEKALHLGADAFLTKPINKKELFDTLHLVCNI